ncbi:hypothetical protein M8C21_018600 [Ambrosia artemisiifolia]|uniref:Peroxidase n=1 Tax=Ambrosia artemisiifolia TaxID=4212 RepID=A0AAD5GE03_AMBAR|nr:hypothetical protein M8C21_018600 [Ambrosia artemisiifolia]
MALSTFSSFFKLSTFTLCLLVMFAPSYGQLTANFYARTCPNFRSIITRAVNSAVANEARMGASLLRLHFHDCFVNASILLLNINLPFQLTFLCFYFEPCHVIILVSFYIILPFSQSHYNYYFSHLQLRGPGWNVLFGRRDSTTASLSAANSNLPSPASSLSTLISSFSNQGFTANEMVALSGSHTIGQARCTTFRNRLYNDNNINASFATALRPNCPSSGGDNNLSPLDSTATSFDNRYFNDLINQRGLLHSDQELFNGGSTDAQVRTYSSNPATFNRDFASAMVKMSNLSPLTGSSGQVRTNCRRTN